ncbi:MAG TPA: STN domain-containing protein, partial [Hanamia sp.]
MKKRQPQQRYFSKEFLKALLIMKLTILFILLGVLKTNADIKAQPGISLNIKNAKIENVIQKIEKQGTYRFLYNTDLVALKSKVDLNIKEFTIAQTMDLLLENTGLRYKLLPDNLVVIQSAQSQLKADIVITGKISGADGIVLVGASIHIKGSNFGV